MLNAVATLLEVLDCWHIYYCIVVSQSLFVDIFTATQCYYCDLLYCYCFIILTPSGSSKMSGENKDTSRKVLAEQSITEGNGIETLIVPARC